MLYLITEDRTSGRDFWNRVFTELLGIEKYKLVPFNKSRTGEDITGNASLDAQVDSALQYSNADDIIFIAFDNIGKSKRINRYSGEGTGFDSGDFVARTIEKCNFFHIRVYFTPYYCFEELYLSYNELARLYKEDGKDARLLNVLNYVREHIIGGTEYFDPRNEYVRYVMNIRKDAGKNKEHFADALLYHATSGIKHGFFRISKESGKNGILKCWTGTCDKLRESDKELSRSDFFCKNCKFKMKNSNSAEKLLDLNDYSLYCDQELTFRDIQNSDVYHQKQGQKFLK